MKAIVCPKYGSPDEDFKPFIDLPAQPHGNARCIGLKSRTTRYKEK
jgi:hypothetical protein